VRLIWDNLLTICVCSFLNLGMNSITKIQGLPFMVTEIEDKVNDF